MNKVAKLLNDAGVGAGADQFDKIAEEHYYLGRIIGQGIVYELTKNGVIKEAASLKEKKLVAKALQALKGAPGKAWEGAKAAPKKTMQAIKGLPSHVKAHPYAYGIGGGLGIGGGVGAAYYYKKRRGNE